MAGDRRLDLKLLAGDFMLLFGGAVDGAELPGLKLLAGDLELPETKLLESASPSIGWADGGAQQGSLTGSVAAQRAMASCRSSAHERSCKRGSNLIEPKDTFLLSCRLIAGDLVPFLYLCFPESARVGSDHPLCLRWIA